MRVRFGGKEGPIPTQGLPEGGINESLPSMLLALETGIFDPTDFIGLGYTHYEVMCVGGAGGKGGNAFYSSYAGYSNYGGGGGGGGMMIVSGLLIDLDSEGEPVVVGAAGGNGADGAPSSSPNPVNQGEAGQDGGFSSFGADICMASGGKGGGGSRLGLGPGEGGWGLNNKYIVPGGTGGEGGVGGQITAGGGGAGGDAEATVVSAGAQETVVWEQTQPEQGSWDQINQIGEGGGGGLGGSLRTEMDDVHGPGPSA